MLLDILIVIFAAVSLVRGREIGFVRELLSTVGFFGGLFLGAWLEPHTIDVVHGAAARTLMTVLTTLGCALVLLTVGEYLGVCLKRKLLFKKLNRADIIGGSALSLVSLLISIWLMAAIAVTLPFPGLQNSVKASRIVTGLNNVLPSAPKIIAGLGHLIDPNGFPEVFIGSEPIPRGDVNIPSLGSLQAAVNKDKDSVVKVEGQGCGGIVEGSGFVVGDGLVATNAHVVAGIRHPFVEDVNGTHNVSVIWFDPNLDLAVLRVQHLAGASLNIKTANQPSGTAAAVLGYPGGGGFTAGPAAVLDQFEASGRNIYGTGNTDRSVYELKADVIPGNSGGPLIDTGGNVIGVIFAESTSYQHVGYALATKTVVSELQQAEARDQVVGTGQCAQ